MTKLAKAFRPAGMLLVLQVLLSPVPLQRLLGEDPARTHR